MHTILINGVEYPYKMTNRARARIERTLGIKLAEVADNITIDLFITMAYEALREGSMIKNKSNDPTIFKLSKEDFEQIDAESDMSIVDIIVDQINDTGKKPQTSTTEATP